MSTPAPALQRLQALLAEVAAEVGLPEPDPDRFAYLARGVAEPYLIPTACRLSPLKPSEEKVLKAIREADEPLMLKEIRTASGLAPSTIAAACAELQRRQMIRHVPEQGYELTEEPRR